MPSFGKEASTENPNTSAPPREAAGGVPGAVASGAQAARQAVDAKSTKPSVPDSEQVTMAAEGGPILGARLEGAGEFVLRPGSFHVGRHSDCEVRIEVRDLGRRHARLTVTPDGVFVEDLNSANGTFINDERVAGRQVLPDGSRVRFATVEFRVTYLREG